MGKAVIENSDFDFRFVLPLTLKLCGANEAQRSLRPNERLVMATAHKHKWLDL